MADRKTEILEATCRVIAREGADGLRMGTVAREAGVSSALLHYYFDTRADLLMQAFEHADVKADEAAEQAIADIPTALGRLQRLLLIYAGADTVFRDAESVRKVALLIRIFARLGCQQLQLNALHAARLLDAKAHPEDHRDLIVRVWGWSGYFCELAPEYQDHVIARHLHAA